MFLYQRPPSTPPGGSQKSSSSSTPSPWAIKKLRGAAAAAKARQDSTSTESSVLAKRLEKEATILKGLSHPNIIGYRGFRRGSDGARLLAVENGEKSLMDMIDEIKEEAEEAVNNCLLLKSNEKD